jgi:hypothetical protein
MRGRAPEGIELLKGSLGFIWREPNPIGLDTGPLALRLNPTSLDQDRQP